MDVVNLTSFTYAPIAGRMPFPGHSLTVLVKGTFDLAPGRAATVAEEALFPSGDEPYPDDEDGTGSCRYESDFAYDKPLADLLLVGRAHTPNGAPARRCRVTFRVGNQARSLLISDDRPFTSVDLRYENSFGGPRFKQNPVGTGHRPRFSFSAPATPPPKIDDSRVSGRPGEPAGFAPLGRAWKDRASRLGTYKKKWLESRWPWFPDDFDWSYFNAAPRAMQRDGYLRGDEELAFENLHPEHASYRSSLPGQRVRCFVNTAPDEGDIALQEIAMNLDTLWVDMEAERLVLLWRGWTRIASPEFEEVRHLLLASEALTDAPQSEAHYAAALAEALEDTEFEAEEPEQDEAEDDEEEDDEELETAMQAMRAGLLAQGIDPDDPPPQTEEQREQEAQLMRELGIEDDEDDDVPWTRERVKARVAEGGSFAEEDLRGLDLSGLELASADLADADLSGVILNGCDLSGANLQGSELQEARLRGARLAGAVLTDADLSRADLAEADLTGATLIGAWFEEASLQGARLCEVKAADSVFRRADLARAHLDAGDFTSADFSGAVLVDAVFRGATLASASLEGARAHNVDLIETDLTRLHAGDGADLTGASLQMAQASDSVWEDSILVDADFSFARLEDADFTSANLQRANFYAADMKFATFAKADLSGAKLVRMNLFEGSLERARLDGAELDGSNLYGVEFLDAVTDRMRPGNANLKMTKLA